MKNKIFILVLVLVSMFCLEVNAEQKTGFSHKNQIHQSVYDQPGSLKTSSNVWNKRNIKVPGGYIFPLNHMIKYFYENNNLKWEYEVEDEEYGYPFIFDYIVNGEELILTECHNTGPHGISSGVGAVEFGCKTKALDLATGEVKKTNNSTGGYYIYQLGENYLVVSPSGFALLDSNLRVVKNFQEDNYNVWELNTDKNTLFMLEYNDNGDYLASFDKDLNLIKRTKLDVSDCFSAVTLGNVHNDTFGMTKGFNTDYYYIMDDFVKMGDKYYLGGDDIYQFDSNGKCKIVYSYAEYNPTNNTFNPGGDLYYSLTKAGEYLVTVGVDDSCGYFDFDGISTSNHRYCPQAVVSVYDKDFNYIEDLSFTTEIEGKSYKVDYNDGSLLVESYQKDTPTLYLDEWILKYNIEAKTDGNGRVEVVDSAYAGDEIVFKVTAKKGYTLKSIKVTGVISGNTIEISAKDIEQVDEEAGYYSVSRNGFIMPEEDVIITAAFEKETPNPDTGLTMTLPIVILFSIGIIMLVFEVKKTKRYI